MRVGRRYFLAYAGGTALAALAFDKLGNSKVVAAPVPGGTLNVRNVQKFVTTLPVPPTMPQSAPNAYSIAMRQVSQQILPQAFAATQVWAYGSTTDERTFHSPAWTVEAVRATPIEVTWINDLKDASGRYLPHLLPVDPTVHWANPPGPRDMRPTFARTPGAYAGPVPTVTHVHGMEGVEDWSDGYAEAWYLPAASNIPRDYASAGTWYEFFRSKSGGRGWAPGQATYRYPNAQRPSTLWFHDHTLGITRLNVYAGPAGFYIIRSDNAADHPTVADGKGMAILPSGQYEIPLAIQDRSFNADGSLFYPDSRRIFDGFAGPYIPDGDVSPIWVPEFFGNCMLVNGRTWPYHSVEPRRYRLRILNGCNSRFLVLRFNEPKVDVWQIGTEAGYLRAAARLRQLLLAPAERVDIIVDFSQVRFGANITLQNFGPDGPYQTDSIKTPADPRTTGQVMQFRVDRKLTSPDTTTHPARLVMPNIVHLASGTERPLALVETMTMTPAGQELPGDMGLGTVDLTAGLPKGVKVLKWHEGVSENPSVGDIEVWAIYNFTRDAHPMHIHEVFFQVVERHRFDAKTGSPVGKKRTPRPEENGWKDTVIAYPGEITRIRLKFTTSGQFAWHCHIVEHEDNEMMRPYRIGPPQPGQPVSLQ
jgi:FtsP/CotA-like multicopper oxidase with cupredoxin domain